MRPPVANHNSLGKLYHEQKKSLKIKILEDLREMGFKDGKIGYWLREITDENLPNMSGNMQDTFIKHIPESVRILKPNLNTESAL